MKHGIKALLITLSLTCAGMAHSAGGDACRKKCSGGNKSGYAFFILRQSGITC